MKALFFLFIFGLFSISCEDIDQSEKDKNLACDEIVKLQKAKDSKEINSLLTQENFLRKGIEQLLYLDMMKQCLIKIDTKTVELIFKDGNFVAQPSLVETLDTTFVKVDYAPYGKMHEFFFDQEHRTLLTQINAITKEYQMKMKEKMKKEKEKKKSSEAVIEGRERVEKIEEL